MVSLFENVDKGNAVKSVSGSQRALVALLAAQEINTYHEEAYFAATPPIECKRSLLFEYSTKRTFNGKPLKISFVDVKKADFHGRPTRNLYVRLPSNTLLGGVTGRTWG